MRIPVKAIVGLAAVFLLNVWLLGHETVLVGANQKPAAKVQVVPFVMREDFQNEGMGQFASYPPAQDIGYEPSLSPTQDYGAPGGRALMRVIKPNRIGPSRFGFIKKVRIVINGGSSLRFTYRLNSAENSALEIGMAAIDGQLFKTRVASRGNQWTPVSLSANDLTDSRGSKPRVNQHIEALYIVADYALVDPDTIYRFLIDDVVFNAARDARFSVKLPVTESVDPWPALFSAQSYKAEDTVAIEAVAPVKLKSAQCFIETTDGRAITSEKLYDDGTHGDSSSGDGIWTNVALYKIKGSDAPGLWQVHLQGTTVDDRTVPTTVRLLVRASQNSSHPRLFFSAADRQKLIERTQDPKLSTLWNHIQTTAKNTRESGELAHGGKVFQMLDREYLLPSLLAYFDVLNRARSRIAYNSFQGYITGDDDARRAAKAALLDAAGWQRWEPPWFRAHGQHTYYPAGLLAAEVALGYDVLFEDLTPAERSVVRQALIEKSIIPTYQEYVVDNRLMANTSNWLAHTVGGALIAAASIADDVQATEANGRFNVYVIGLLQKLEDHMAASFLPDGSYGEGISYQEFDLETLGPALNALRRAFGVDYWKMTRVLDSLSYAIYTTTQPVSASLDMGDTHPPAGHGIPALIYESRDPLVRWYYTLFDRPNLSKFIFYDDSVEPKGPTIPPSKIFWDRGAAVFRSGWGKDDLVFLYRAGPNFNHHHADQGSFLLSGFGENLISEAGWSDYYKDPYYVTYFTQAIGHSTVLVDGNPESQIIADTPQFAALNNYPRITAAVTSEFYDALSSELSSVYNGRLEQFTRSVVFVKPHYFLIFDKLRADGPNARFNWLLHLPDRDTIEVTSNVAVHQGERGSLAVRSFHPNQSQFQIRDGRIPYHIFAARTPATVPPQPAYLDLATNTSAKDAQFLVALVPAPSTTQARDVIRSMTAVNDDTWSGIRTTRGKQVDLVMFRVGDSGPGTYQDWSTDANAWTIGEDEQLRMVAAQSARNLSRAGKMLVGTDIPASFAVRFNTDAVEVSLHTTAPTGLRLSLPKSPERVQLNGQNLTPTQYRYAGETISLSVPKGEHRILISVK